jgi:hypothetical protein
MKFYYIILYYILLSQIQFISNPCTFSVNEIIFSVANFDFASNTIKNSINQNINPLNSALESVLLQRSFLPFIPMNNNLIDESIENILRVDYRYLSKLDLNIIPDVILTNSQIKFFTKVSNSTLFVNPCCFYKGDNLGYACKMIIKSPDINNDNNFNSNKTFLNVKNF